MLLLLACHTPEKPDEDSPAPSDPNPVYAEGDCPTPLPGWTCGTVTLAADHGSGDGETITLSTAVRTARSGTSEAPLALFTGGPGGSIFDLAALVERGGVMAPLNEEHDVVLMSERGTFGATPMLDCPELADVDVLFDSPAEDRRVASREAFATCHDRLVAEGVDLALFDNDQRADDVPEVLTALGYDAWHLWGVSGGAVLAQRVVARHPDGVLSALLDSGGFPNAHMHDIPVVVTSNADARWDRMLTECAADPTCAAAYPDLAADLDTLVATLEAKPASLSVTLPTTGETRSVALDGHLFLSVATSSFDGIAYFPLVIEQGLAGEYDLVEGVLPGLLAADTGESFADGLYMSVLCADIGDVTADMLEPATALPALNQAVLPDVESLLETCAAWDVPFRAPGESLATDVPMLYMEGSYDANRPPEWGAEAAADDTWPHLAEFPAHAHVVLDACAVEIMGQVMDDPTGEPDTSCIPAAVEWVVP